MSLFFTLFTVPLWFHLFHVGVNNVNQFFSSSKGYQPTLPFLMDFSLASPVRGASNASTAPASGGSTPPVSSVSPVIGGTNPTAGGYSSFSDILRDSPPADDVPHGSHRPAHVRDPSFGLLDVTTMSQLVSTICGVNGGIQQLRTLMGTITFPSLSAAAFQSWHDSVLDTLSVHHLSALIQHPFSIAIRDPGLLLAYGDSNVASALLEQTLCQFSRHIAVTLLQALPPDDRSILQASRDRLDPYIIMSHLRTTYHVDAVERLRRARTHMRSVRLSTAGSMRAYLTDFRTTANTLQSLGCTVHTPEYLLDLLFLGVDVRDYSIPIAVIKMHIQLSGGTKGLLFACSQLQAFADDKAPNKSRRAIVAHVASVDLCSFCEAQGHLESTCPMKHPCTTCGKKGHLASIHQQVCRNFRRGTCRYGAKCYRQHPATESPATTTSSSGTSAPPSAHVAAAMSSSGASAPISAHVAAGSVPASAPARPSAPAPVAASAPVVSTPRPALSAPVAPPVCDFCSLSGHSMGACHDYIFYRSQVSAFRRQQAVGDSGRVASASTTPAASSSVALASLPDNTDDGVAATFYTAENTGSLLQSPPPSTLGSGFGDAFVSEGVGSVSSLAPPLLPETKVPVCVLPPTGVPVAMRLPLISVGAPAYPVAHLVKPTTSPVASSILMDSGASHHMTPRREILVNYRASNNGLRGVNTAGIGAPPLECSGTGDLYLRTTAGLTVCLKNVWHVPTLRVSLFSTNLALSRGYTSESTESHSIIKRVSTGSVVLTGCAKPGSVLHWLDATAILPADLPRADFAGDLRL